MTPSEMAEVITTTCQTAGWFVTTIEVPHGLEVTAGPVDPRPLEHSAVHWFSWIKRKDDVVRVHPGWYLPVADLAAYVREYAARRHPIHGLTKGYDDLEAAYCTATGRTPKDIDR